MDVIEYLRLQCPGRKERVEMFLVEKEPGVYASLSAHLGGINISTDILGMGTEKEAWDALDLERHNLQRNVSGYECPYEVAATEMDDQAEKALLFLLSPQWGVDWPEETGAIDVQRDFYAALQSQLQDWKGTSSALGVLRHPYWPKFRSMVRDAVREQYGDRFPLYRGVYGPVARDVIGGAPFPLGKLDSWTADKGYAKEFVLYTPGGADRGRNQDWVTVQAHWTPEDVLFAPVALPEFTPNPRILVEAFANEDEFVVQANKPKLPSGEYRIMHKTRRQASVETDVLDALDHISDEVGTTALEDYTATETELTIEEVYAYDDVDAWLEVDEGELVDASRQEVLDWAEEVRGPHFAQVAAKALDTGELPAIVIVDTPEVTTVGDGRGRINLAVALGIDRIPAVILTPKKQRTAIAPQLNLRTLFNDVATQQRGEPEDAMMVVQETCEGGVMSNAVEHIGDLIHRMTEHTTFDRAGYEHVKDKVDKMLRLFTNDYGFEREYREQLESNARYLKKENTRFVSDCAGALRTYADAHAELPVYNEAQALAQHAAVSLGREEFSEVVWALKGLKRHLGSEKEWVEYAHRLDENAPQGLAQGVQERDEGVDSILDQFANMFPTASVLYRGHVYREALTPQQKEMKKDWLLRQELAKLPKDPKIPTWEEVLDQYGDELTEQVEGTYGEMFRDEWEEAYESEMPTDIEIENEAEAQVMRNHPDLDLGDSRFDELEAETAEKLREEWREELHDHAKAYADQVIFGKVMRDYFEPDYEKAVSRLKRLEEKDCWRVVALPEGADPREHTDLGVYWVDDEEYASAMWAPESDRHEYVEWEYHGRVDAQYVDVEATIQANIYGLVNSVPTDQNEIRFVKHAPIFVYSVKQVGWPITKHKELPINDWRRC